MSVGGVNDMGLYLILETKIICLVNAVLPNYKSRDCIRD